MSFRSLPLELHEDIATHIETDNDLCNYTLICHESYNAVHSQRCAVWRALFVTKYDLPAGRNGREIMQQYIRRRMILSRGIGTGFRQGHREVEVHSLNLLRDLVIESYSSHSNPEHGKRYSNNLSQLQHFVKASNLLDVLLFRVPRSDTNSRLLQTLQLVFTHYQLDLSIRSRIRGFGYSQQAVYSHPTDMPIFLDKKWNLNLEYLIHIINFFKYHMKTETENTLYPLLCDLEAPERPQAWNRPIRQGHGVKPLAARWKGSYAYIPELDDLNHIRDVAAAGIDLDSPIPDAIDYDEGFQTLEIDSLPMTNSTPWPAVFEDHLQALPPKTLRAILRQEITRSSQHESLLRRSGRTLHGQTLNNPFITPSLTPRSSSSESPARHSRSIQPAKKTKTQAKSDPGPQPRKDYLQFSGSGRDYQRFHCNGIIHNLPPQSGIPGWQRICMMKYYVQENSSSSSGTSSPSSSPSSATFSSASSSASSASSDTWSSNIHAASTNQNPFAFSDDMTDDQQFVLDNTCWCYEGIVLPGGRIILGRWWSPLDAEAFTDMGPFIFWNIDQGE